MTIGVNDLKKAIEFGSDIEFMYNSIPFTILPWTDDGIVIGPQNSDNDQFFKSAEDLINTYKIDGKAIKDILPDIDILLM